MFLNLKKNFKNELSERTKNGIPSSQVKLFSFIVIVSDSIIFLGTSLVAQWLRVCLPMQGTRVLALVREDPTCHGATKHASHNY